MKMDYTNIFSEKGSFSMDGKYACEKSHFKSISMFRQWIMVVY